MGAYHAEMMDALMRQQSKLRDECDANEDIPTVPRAQAIAMVTACLMREEPSAFGLTTAEWTEHLWNELADNQGGVLLALLVGATIPSIGEFLDKLLGDSIEGLANRQLAEADPDELEQYL